MHNMVLLLWLLVYSKILFDFSSCQEHSDELVQSLSTPFSTSWPLLSSGQSSSLRSRSWKKTTPSQKFVTGTPNSSSPAAVVFTSSTTQPPAVSSVNTPPRRPLFILRTSSPTYSSPLPLSLSSSEAPAADVETTTVGGGDGGGPVLHEVLSITASHTTTLEATRPPSEEEIVTTSSSSHEHVTTINEEIHSTKIPESTFNFVVRPYAKFPTTMLQVNYTKLPKYRQYRINYVDDSSGEVKTYNTTIVNESPFIIQNLSPGHKYTVEFYAQPVGAVNPVGLGVTMEMTDPVPPKFRSNSTTVDTNTIRIRGEKETNALQDYYIINYVELDASHSSNNGHDFLNVTDIKDQRFVDFLIPNLNPGRNYNVSITPFRVNRSGQPYREIIATLPLPPRNVRVESDSTSEVNVAWNAPENSGVDKYVVKFFTLASPNNISEFNPIEETSTILSVSLKPGEKYHVMVYSVKASRFSVPSNVSATIKPLPPSDLMITPDFDRGSFVIEVVTSSESKQDACYLQYISEEPSSGRLDAHNESTIVTGTFCRWTDLPLKPGQSYHLQIWTMSNFTASDVLSNSSVTIEPAFDVDKFGIVVLPQETSFEVQWDQVRIGYLWRGLVGDHGNISVSLSGDAPMTKMMSPIADTKSSPKVVFDGLISGRCYVVHVYSTVAGIVSRNRTRLTVRTDPIAVLLTVHNRSSSNVNLALKPSTFVRLDDSCRVVLSVKDRGDTFIFNRTFAVGSQGASVEVNDLKPFTKYDISGYHFCGVQSDECAVNRHPLKEVEFETAQGIPGPVFLRSVETLTPSIASLRWDRPEEENGVITNYIIMIRPEPRSGENPWNFTTAANVNKVDIQNLTGGFVYTFDVRAQTEAGVGQPAATEKGLSGVKMLIWAPPKPVGKPEILSNTVRETDFSIRFNLTMFSTRNGLLTNYAIIVAEGEDPRDVNASLTWYDVRNVASPWPSYLAVSKSISSSKILDPTPIVEVIGVDVECTKETSNFSPTPTLSNICPYCCNGPLKSGRPYRVKLRAYTHPDLYADSEFSDIVTTNAEGGSTAGTAVAVILALLVLLAFVLGVLLFLRGRGVDPVQNCLKKSSNFLSPDCAANGAVGGNRRQRSLRERAGVDGRLDKLHHHHPHHLPMVPTIIATANTEISRPVRKSDFAEHVRLMSADSDFRYSEEYEDLKQVGRNQACNAADLPCNRNKNRFTNILPYDHSRVKLIPVDDEEGSDFINASYIPAYNSPREYIATQGPLPSTRDDFWRMVWEQNSPSIINLTRCIEKGREKCDQYWPIDNEPVCYGDIEVVVMNETRFPDWTIREFKLNKGDQSRTVRHFHFTAWPDFGVPERPQVLIKFVRAFRFRTPPDTRPIVAHCSAGVGRSGTFIALDRLLQHILHDDLVDIFGIVHEMRKERVCMVQTEQQYICIHQCLLCVLECRENEDSPYLFPRPIHGAEVHQNPAFEDDEGIAESGV